MTVLPNDQTAKAQLDIDPITVEVIRRRLISIADQIDRNVSRTAYSLLVYEYKDYAVGIVDDKGRLLSQCTGGMPLFVADVLGAAIREGLAVYGKEGIREGDIIVTNFSGTIGQHLNNVVMYTPIFAKPNEELAGFFVIVMHWLDIGGRVVGSISKYATDIFQEGIQFHCVKLHSRGEPVPEIYRMIGANTRFPDEVMGDIAAQVGGCIVGRNDVAALIGRYGLSTFRASVETIWQQSEEAARVVIRSIPDGTYYANAFLDDDGLNAGKNIPLKVKVIVREEELTVDLSELPKETESTMNAGFSGGGQSVARLAFRYLIIPNEHANEGSFRPLKLILPQGTVMSASPKAAKGHYNLALPTLIDLVIRALSAAVPDRVAAGHYATFSTIRFVGNRPNDGALFQCSDSGYGGWGALCDEDGPGPFRTMCHGDTRIIPIEVQEASYPIFIEHFALKADSGGNGQFRGGLGLSKSYVVNAPCTLFTTFDRTECPAWGVANGMDGAPGSVIVESASGDRRSALKENMKLQAGDRVLIATGGGGGFGPPRRRSREKVIEDLTRGYVSKEVASSVYGMHFD